MDRPGENFELSFIVSDKQQYRKVLLSKESMFATLAMHGHDSFLYRNISISLYE